MREERPDGVPLPEEVRDGRTQAVPRGGGRRPDGRVARWQGALARGAVLCEAVSVSTALVASAILVAGMRSMDYPYPGLIRVVNVPYALAIAGLLAGIVLLLAWVAGWMVRRRAPSAKAAAWALALTLAAVVAQMLVMSQYRHLD